MNERKESTQGKHHRSAGGRQSAPGSKLRAADPYLERHTFLGCQAACDVDVEIWKRREKVLIVAAHRVTPVVVFSPRFIVLPCPVTEGSHNPRQAMGVFARHVFLHDRKLSPCAGAEICGHISSR